MYSLVRSVFILAIGVLFCLILWRMLATQWPTACFTFLPSMVCVLDNCARRFIRNCSYCFLMLHLYFFLIQFVTSLRQIALLRRCYSIPGRQMGSNETIAMNVGYPLQARDQFQGKTTYAMGFQ